MPFYQIVICVLIAVLGAFIVFYLFPTMLVTNVIYRILLVRTNKNKWSRTCSWENPEQEKMFALGTVWGEENAEYRKPVSIKNGKFNLVGEYFDFGFNKAVIIVPGRMETLNYSYYYAEPYKQSGYNVLVIDNRSHGLSDGRYNNVGIKEYKDIIVWANMLKNTFNVDSLALHGICIGSATCLYALTSKNCPSFINKFVADGMYTTFAESFKNHLIERKKPTRPFVNQMSFILTVTSGKNPVRFSPINRIKYLKVPTLFLYSKEDIYSLPDKAQKLYDACPSTKKLVWFDKGEHSHLRITNTDLYDSSVKEFLSGENHE